MKTQNKRKIVFISEFSNEELRNNLSLSDRIIENTIRSIFGHKMKKYVDRVVWVSEYIKEFEKDAELEYHIVSLHSGMNKLTESFTIRNVHYHVIRQEPFFLKDYICNRFKIYQHNYYKRNRRLINKFIKKIDPDLIVVCGADNAYYALSILDIQNKPIFSILQSLRNNPKLKQFENNEWDLTAEKMVLKKSNYFGGGGMLYYNLLKDIVPHPIFLKLGFPQGTPPIYKDLVKNYDFFFYAARIAKNKGVEDVLKAFKIVCQRYPQIKLGIAGGASDEYLSYLRNEYITPFKMNSNVILCGFFQKFQDLYKEVQKSNFVILPGISAPLNGTIRESMQMGLPVIAYETDVTKKINDSKIRILTAEMGNYQDLANKMIYAIENPEAMVEIAKSGKEYADIMYNSSSISKQLISDFKVIIEHYYEQKEIPSSNLLLQNYF